MPIAIINGDLTVCTQGSQPCPLVVTNHRKVMIDDQPAATVLDHSPGVNLATYGTCKVTGGPCTPATAAPWLRGSAKNVQANDQRLLLASDKLMCAAGGVISISGPKQARNVQDM
ncbi:MAG: DUF4280 domain-containing protein [Gemmataceae bacterium]